MSSQLFYYNPAVIEATTRRLDADVCIYGSNAAGVVAAVQAKKMGRSVVLLEPGNHIGGLTAGGLSKTDTGKREVIGGLSREFYRRCGAHYGVEEEWVFEPRVAEKVLWEMLNEAQIEPIFRQFLQGVEKEGGRITAITLEGGLRVAARYFIDCSYEGDLMARAGVSYHVGRESNSVYNETLNGAQIRQYHQFEKPVDPYIVEGDPSSGLLPGVEESTYEQGEGDHRVQAYNFRLCVTRDRDNQIPFEKPEGYDPQEYVLLARDLATGWDGLMRKYDEIRGNKCDVNNYGAVSTDFIGRNFDYPEADYARREEIFQAHVTYQKGLMWFRSYDPAVPEKLREQQLEWQLPKDEFVETGGWPHQLYIREARRMISDYVVTQHDCQGERTVEDSIGMASYTMDSHNCRRLVIDGRVLNEGDVQVAVPPYRVPVRSIRPRRAECENLLVPVCLSTSHIAYGSARMEPVFMIMGQSAATLAALAAENNSAVQDVPYEELRAQLLRDRQILEA